MREYFTFGGRLARKPYWLRQIVITALLLVVGIIHIVVTGPEASDTSEYPAITALVRSVLFGAVYVVATVAFLAAQVRRLHDRNRSGWWILLVLCVPAILLLAYIEAMMGHDGPALIGAAVCATILLWFLVDLGFLKGTPGSNRFGHDPLVHDEDADVFD